MQVSAPRDRGDRSGDRLRSFFTQGAIDQRIRPLLAMEQFTAG